MSEQYQVTLQTRDGEAVAFDCLASQNLLEAAAEAGYQLPSICQSGNCGSCLGHKDKGDIELGTHSPEILSDEAKANGSTLFCCSFPRSDITVSIDQTLAAISAPVLVPRAATVTDVTDVGGDVMHLRLQLDATEDGNIGVEFEAGQYMELTLPDGSATRAYSIANTPNWEGVVEFYIRLRPDGVFSSWLQQAKVGDTLSAKGPGGDFTLDESGLSPRWFIGGGTGLAPVLSMLRWMGEMGAMQQSRLFFGVNTEQEIFANTEINELKAMLPSLKTETCIWKPETDWGGYTGTAVDALHESLSEVVATGSQPDIYVCGPPALIEGCEQVALDLGLPSEKFHAERFTPS